MRLALGDIAVGSFPGTRISPPVAGRILDLYDRVWQGRALNARGFAISADEKSSIQARRRKQPTLAPASGRSTRVEHEYFREGAWTYLAAWDVHRAKVFGCCEKKSGIAPVDRLIREVMSQEPYKSARFGRIDLRECRSQRPQWCFLPDQRHFWKPLARLSECLSVRSTKRICPGPHLPGLS